MVQVGKIIGANGANVGADHRRQPLAPMAPMKPRYNFSLAPMAVIGANDRQWRQRWRQ